MLDDGSVGVLIAVAKDSCKVLTNKVSMARAWNHASSSSFCRDACIPLQAVREVCAPRYLAGLVSTQG